MGLCLKHFSTTRNGRKHTIVMNVFRFLTKLCEMGPGMIELKHLETISDKDASVPKNYETYESSTFTSIRDTLRYIIFCEGPEPSKT